jgi:hypothetical protein
MIALGGLFQKAGCRQEQYLLIEMRLSGRFRQHSGYLSMESHRTGRSGRHLSIDSRWVGTVRAA